MNVVPPVKRLAVSCAQFLLWMQTDSGITKPFMVNFGIEHHSQPGAIYLSQCSELGTIYKPEEICALTEFAHRHGLFVHMDGARISNAAAGIGNES